MIRRFDDDNDSKVYEMKSPSRLTIASRQKFSIVLLIAKLDRSIDWNTKLLQANLGGAEP